MAFITSKILAASQKKQSREHSAAINGKTTCAETRERAALMRRVTSAAFRYRFSSFGLISVFDVVPTSLKQAVQS